MAKVDVEGGGISHIAALKRMELDDQSKNWEMYSNWADSVRSFPQVVKQKVEGEIKTYFYVNLKASSFLP